MKPYLVIQNFYYDGNIEKARSHILLLEEPYEEEYSGTDFDSLWNFICEHPGITPFGLWEVKKGKRFIQHYDWLFKSITPKNCKPWKFTITCRETTVTMKQLMCFDTEKVIKYLKERGITTCPMIK